MQVPYTSGAKLTKVKSEEFEFTQQPVRLPSGGGHTERRGGGGVGRETHVLLETPPLWEKIHRAVTFDPTHISSLNNCIPQYTCDP